MALYRIECGCDRLHLRRCALWCKTTNMRLSDALNVEPDRRQTMEVYRSPVDAAMKVNHTVRSGNRIILWKRSGGTLQFDALRRQLSTLVAAMDHGDVLTVADGCHIRRVDKKANTLKLTGNKNGIC